MGDPLEGVTADGMITTGAARDRVPPPFEPVVHAAIEQVERADRGAALYLYGSVATGQATVGRSDVDLLSIGLDSDFARSIGHRLSIQFASVCRGVEIGAAQPSDLDGDGDEAYGFRVFLRHYCAPLTGPARYRPTIDFPADERAARGFNGDIARHAQRWRATLDETADPNELDLLATRVGRKTLLAVAGLVSISGHTWTTDRTSAARQWGEREPSLADGLALLRDRLDRPSGATADEIELVLTSTIRPIVGQFAEMIGLWPDEP